jgi:diguanylate cyclase
MADSSANYRAKYVQALKDQERLEKQHSFQLDLLKKAMLRLGVAASGLDANLDASLERLRETMRGGSGVQVSEQLERVQKAVDAFEVVRKRENEAAAKQLSSLSDQYQALQIPSSIRSGLKDFNKALGKRLENYRQYPAALQDLVKLQELALEAASNPDQGFWQRLRGGRSLQAAEPETAPEKKAKPAEVEDSEEVKPADVIEHVMHGEHIAAGESAIHDSEDSYEKVARRIAETLENLVEKIRPNAVIKHKVDIVRLRIERGMDWFALAVTLEDIRDILFLRYLQADEEFSDYLNQVKGELQSIRSALSGAEEREHAQNQAADKFSDAVSTRVGKIQDSIAGTANIDSLKDEVTDHLSYIHSALEEFRSSRQAPVSLSDELKQLVSRVQSIESESKKTKAALEEQRHKATHDALTGLPNREAYNERAFHELERFKRYGRPLSMAVCDIDYFKKINDTYGHQAGDKVLKLIAKLISTRLRNVDFAARFGGEEFVILMPETEPNQAQSVLEKIRKVIGKTPFRFKESPVQITISFGIVGFTENDSVESAFERADKALYKAKEEGRNRCVIAS